MRITTPVTARNGLVVTKLGIGPCSFITCDGAEGDDEVATGDGHDLHRPSRGDLGIGCGGHVVRSAGEADEYRAATVCGGGGRHPAPRSRPILQGGPVRRPRPPPKLV